MLAKLLLINLVIYCVYGADENRDNAAVLADLFQNQLGGQTSPNVESSKQPKRPGIDVKLQNHSNGYYIGEIIVGTAAPGTEEQKFSVVFDTGSIDLWIPSVEACLSGGVLCDTEKYHSGFDARKSSTFQPLNLPYVAKYGDGLEAKGYAATDVLKIRSGQSEVSEVLVPKLTFAVVESAATDSDQADGIFGLGFGTQSTINGNTESPFESMVRQAGLKPQFGFFFNNENDAEDKKSGHLFFGGYDESLVESEFTFAKLYKTSFFYTSWEIAMDGVTVGGTPQTMAVGVKTLVDSGTATIRVSSALYESMFNQMPQEYASTLRENSFDCKAIDLAKLPKVTFIINKTPFELDPVDYIEGEDSYQDPYLSEMGIKTFCYFMIKALPSELGDNLIILGVPFMRKFYTLFDVGKKEIGFARARHGPKDNNVAPKTSRMSNFKDSTSQTVSNTNVSEKPKTSPESKPKTSPESKPKTYPEPKPNTSPESKPNTSPESKPNTSPESKPNTSPESKPNTSPESKPNTSPESKPNTSPESKPKTSPESKPKTYPEPKPNTSPESKPNTSPESKANTSPESKPKTSPESKPKTSPESKPKTSPESKPKTYPEPKPNTSPESKPNTSPESKPNTSPESKPKTSPESKPNTSPESKPKSSKSQQHSEVLVFRGKNTTEILVVEDNI